MTDRSTSIENLQTALSMELTAVHQYLLHAHTLEDWGIDKLAARMREEMQEELGHAGAFIDRIMFLGGVPKLEAADSVFRYAWYSTRNAPADWVAESSLLPYYLAPWSKQSKRAPHFGNCKL